MRGKQVKYRNIPAGIYLVKDNNRNTQGVKYVQS